MRSEFFQAHLYQCSLFALTTTPFEGKTVLLAATQLHFSWIRVHGTEKSYILRLVAGTRGRLSQVRGGCFSWRIHHVPGETRLRPS
jgi:hypothetical protein